ncbi:hypothetical protein RhiirA1_444138 [Rhizophagus irregularis]|uniref:HTH myb-type domain-containing protein n=3 Tax=Rhizophagus irregularis TaxID=588596 RepID=A0A2N0RFG7_9GLOM|nr:hypothetical protein GLOIN_2v1844521 [Rhizophagus irregularis DAOM 181602=DAOM 197198]PKC62028.1 hypothetical protein RhiirA1_444138 [Rhizophagus irregularis]POG65819.1 hypothetical protein GLOIN_2v1844521 [Rhizophagus irregularis DAOM 181602=DAOM 197198]UZO12017.1 hypothetical protein OCT59_003568 [Rhizophagus irregularis]CAB4485643.1 unnamed protein product [Rhizophagus irregularis]CAG8685740.1 111_t:CDS:2 [Rhizophagus irregularis]|eukprot:XP_025172685.1 hypothetical protein GLOIN_2v1844521 [Rhizophagus irregularis DAOM 181602=DAOM 197198]
MGKVKGPLFNKNVDNKIMMLKKEWENHPNNFKMISKQIPQYNAKQIRQRWKNHLDPNLCHEPLDEAEKSFIVQWVKVNQTTPTATIHWKDLISAMKDRFGKLRSENKIKNFWYLKQRSLKLETRIEQEMQQEVDSKYTVDDDNNDIMSFQSPFESIITNMFFDFC